MIEVQNLELLYLFVEIKNNLDGRVVVLRKADEKNLSLQFHSDIRSTKD